MVRFLRESGQAWTTYVILREPPAHHSMILVQVPVNTWQAYNGRGGMSLYEFDYAHGQRANHVSFDRPYAWKLQGGQSPLVWEIQTVRFLERLGYDVSYQTDVDTHRDPGSLLRHRLVLVNGHDEYWTKQIFDAFDAARDRGTNLAFMGANVAYLQVRYEDGERTIVAYKSFSDPIADPALKTVRFRELAPPRYECSLIGIQHLGAVLDWPPGTTSRRGPLWTTRGWRGPDSRPATSSEGWSAPSRTRSRVTRPRRHRARTPSRCSSTGSAAATRTGTRMRSAIRIRPAPACSPAARTSGAGARLLPLRQPGRHVPADPRIQRFMTNALDDLARPALPTAVTALVRRSA